MTPDELIKQVAADKVKFMSLQFTDIAGTVKSVDIPIDRLDYALESGIWFDGSSVEGFARVQESDMRLILDPETYVVLPWSDPELRRARIFCDIFTPDGEPFAGDPRGLLKRMLKYIKDKYDWEYQIGPEPEFFLYKQSGGDNPHPVPYDVGGYFDFSADDDALRTRVELMDALKNMGLEVEMGHHEVALGQHEINFRFSDALRAADNVLTLKYTAKAIASKYNLIASFMPKPVYGINGSGMHCHQSLAKGGTENVFYDASNEHLMSEVGLGFIAGQLMHARALSAIVAPTVNSYKRLVPGYEAPVYVGWANINRSALIRIPSGNKDNLAKSMRAELRFPDPSCNPYLAFATMLAAALDGIENKMKPAEPLNNVNIWRLSEEEREKRNIDQLPGSLGQALKALEDNEVIQNALGDFIYPAFMRAKGAEWKEYTTRVTDWEVERYLKTV